MLLSMNWISDFVDLSGLDRLDLIARFSLATAEVENDIQKKGADISGIVVAEIKSVAEHPESKKLHLPRSVHKSARSPLLPGNWQAILPTVCAVRKKSWG